MILTKQIYDQTRYQTRYQTETWEKISLDFYDPVKRVCTLLYNHGCNYPYRYISLCMKIMAWFYLG